MIKSKRQKDILIGIITSLAVTIIFAISYAAFSQTLNINGSGTVRNSTWNIHFVGEGELEPSNTLSSSVKVLTKPSISETTVGNYSVSLTTPGDTISYTFSVINEGDYNAKISNFNLPSPVCKVNGDATDESAVKVCNKLSYSLKYDNGATVSNNDILLSKETKTLVLTLEYEEFDNEALLPTSDVEISNLGFTINYVQDGNALVNNDGTTPYNPYPVGREITIAGEQYYVISSTDSYVTLLKANPLTVEEVNTYGAGHINRYTSPNVGTAYNSNGYGGMQYYSSETCGYVNGSWVYTGCTTDYASSEVKYAIDAWASSKFTNGELVPDSNGYQARLITREELDSLGYVYSSGYYPKNDNIPSWIWNRNYWYWTMSPYNSSPGVWRVDSNGYVNNNDVSSNGGVVRPVINVYKSNL